MQYNQTLHHSPPLVALSKAAISVPCSKSCHAAALSRVVAVTWAIFQQNPGQYFPTIDQRQVARKLAKVDEEPQFRTRVYLFFVPGLGLHSSPVTGCSLILIGYCGVFPLKPLLQS